jgi:nucleosome assembly protein 1-like 1
VNLSHTPTLGPRPSRSHACAGGKDAGKTRTITKTVPQDSFFHFFKPPQIPEDADPDSPELEIQRAMLNQDFDVSCDDLSTFLAFTLRCETNFRASIEVVLVHRLQLAFLIGSRSCQIGDILKDRVIPNAVLYFTNEANDEDDFSDGFGEEGDDGDYPGDDEDDDEEEVRGLLLPGLTELSLLAEGQ